MAPTSDTNETDSAEAIAEGRVRDVALSLETGDVVIYDPANRRAWVMSDVAFERATVV